MNIKPQFRSATIRVQIRILTNQRFTKKKHKYSLKPFRSTKHKSHRIRLQRYVSAPIEIPNYPGYHPNKITPAVQEELTDMQSAHIKKNFLYSEDITCKIYTHHRYIIINVYIFASKNLFLHCFRWNEIDSSRIS